MTISKINWSRDLVGGARVVVVVLVAGIPRVLTPAGVRPTTVAVTGSTVHPLFWPGTGSLTETLPDASTFDPVADLLDVNETWEVFERASPLKGDVRVEALTFSLLDTDGAATALLSVREARTAQYLTGDLSAAATSIPLGSTTGFPSTGIAAIGRETITYGGIGGGSLTSATRGKYGSLARPHLCPASHRPLVCAGGARHWQGRLATVWLCTLSADGATISDPTLLYQGTVGAGIQLAGNLTRWSVPLDHVSESLSRKVSGPSVDLYGYAHYSLEDYAHPLSIAAQGVDATLAWSSSAEDNEGWHVDRDTFVFAANTYADSVTASAVHVTTTADGRVSVLFRTATNATCTACWYEGARWIGNTITPPRAFATAPAPEACFHLEGWVKVPLDTEFAAIPTTFRWNATTTDGAAGSASLALVADTAATKALAATIVERDAARQAVRVVASLPARAEMSAAEIHAAARCLTRTTAHLGVVATGDSPVAALKAAALAIDALTGQDLYQSAVDWDHLERALASAPSTLPQAREYRFGASGDSFLDVLIDELRLRGMAMACRDGLLTGVRLQTFADTEATSDTITEADLLTDEQGRELPTKVVDNNEPLASRMTFELPTPRGTRTVTIVDTTFQDEFGEGEAVTCKALLNLPPGTLPAGVEPSLYSVAEQILGVLAEPNRSISLPVSPTKLGLQPGQLVAFTHARIPTWSGARGVTAAVCQVVEVRRQIFGGRLRGVVTLRLQSGTRSGYAPEALVAAGGLSSISPVVTLDIASAWGANGFAPDTDAAGNVVTDPSGGFAVGHGVRLSQLARTPIASESFVIVSIDTTAHTITLDGNPTVNMANAATGQYGVSLRFESYGSCTANQKSRWAFLADPTTQLLGGTDAPKRWAA